MRQLLIWVELFRSSFVSLGGNSLLSVLARWPRIGKGLPEVVNEGQDDQSDRLPHHVVGVVHRFSMSTL